MHSNAYIAALLITGLVTVGTPAAVTAGGPPSDPETAVLTDKARQLYEEGLAAIQKSKWLEARASLLAAWSLNKHWQIAANLAGCEIELGKHRDAAEHAAYYLHNAPVDRRAKAELVLNRAKAKIGTLTIDAKPVGAEVLVDEVSVGRAPLGNAIYVDPGPHRVLVRSSGRPDALQSITLAAGESKVIAIAAVPEARPPRPAPERRPLWPVIVGAGATVAAIGVGTGLTLAANGKGSSIESFQSKLAGNRSACTATPPSAVATSCEGLKGALGSRDTLSNAAIGSFVAAGALALATVGLGVWTATGPKADEKGSGRGLRVVPALGAGGAGLVAIGIW